MKTRASAYVLAIDEGRVLLTQLAASCWNGGHWTLPGGGIDHGEQPMQTVVREAHEETSLAVNDLRLFHARTFSEDGKQGPFLALQVVYTGVMRGEPRVLEQGGSTAAVRWIPLGEVASLPTVALVDEVLSMWHQRG